MNWIAPLGLALAATGSVAAGCSSPTQVDSPEGSSLGQASSATGVVQISLDQAPPEAVIARIDTALIAYDISVTVEVTDGESGKILASPTVYPVGSTNSFVIELQPEVRNLTFRALDTATGKPLGSRLSNISVQLTPANR